MGSWVFSLPMAKLNFQQIRDFAVQLIAKHPGGIRYGEVVRAVRQAHPETPGGTVVGCIWKLHESVPDKVSKPSRGLFVPVAAGSQPGVAIEAETRTKRPSIREQEFYQSFADYLEKDLDEVTKAAPLGGAGLKSKWGTPDIVGVYRATAADLIKFPLEIIAAEVKTDSTEPVVAFGQATAYRLFATKTYVVMPREMREADLSRLEALCMLYGVGLVLFDLDVGEPNYDIRVRAQRHIPDMFYVNEFAERLRSHDPDAFRELFG